MKAAKFTGRRFAKKKPLATIKAQCKAQGVEFDDFRYRKLGSDFVTLRGGGAVVVYSTFNGWFFGTTPDDTEFDSHSTRHEREPWFQALLEFFYEGEPAMGRHTGA